MPDAGAAAYSEALWLAGGVLALIVALAVLFLWFKGRPVPGRHVFRASRFSRAGRSRALTSTPV